MQKYIKENTIMQIDAIKGMDMIEPHSIDLIIADLPYGQTQNKYDKIIPFDKMWEAIHKVIKTNGAVCLFGSSKFYIQLCASNLDEWRHEYTWNKILTSGFLSAQWQPLRQHENIAVFYQKKPTYNPQFTIGKPLHSKGSNRNKNFINNNYNEFELSDDSRAKSRQKYPTDILNYPVKDSDIDFYVDGINDDEQIYEILDFVDFQKVHPSKSIHQTEKPSGLCDFLVRTYSNEGDTILDFCCGSGSVPLSAIRNGRKYIGFDIGECLNPKSENYNLPWADIAQKRIDDYIKNPQISFNSLYKEKNDVGEQTSLFKSA